MIRSVLLHCVLILAASCFACAPLPPPPPYPPSPLVATCPDGSTFLSHVSMLAANYNPGKFETPTASSTSLSNQEQADLSAAFIAAPMRFQKALCNLSGIYIDPSASYSWGFRDPKTQQYRYIGLSQQSLWGSSGQSSPPNYSSSETTLICQVLVQLSAPWPPAPPCPAASTTTAPNPPTFSGATNTNTTTNVTTSVDTPAMTVLAALAHEYGHILWYDLIRGNNKSDYVPADFCRSYPGVRGDGFFDKSWSSVRIPARFLTFAYLSSDQHISGDVQTTTLTSAINSQNWPSVVNYLNEYFTPYSSSNKPNGVWPSVFGSISPEEDFVETFKIYIMTKPDTNGGAPVTSMPLKLYAAARASPISPPPDIYQEIYQDITRGNQHERKRKMDCIDVKWAGLVH